MTKPDFAARFWAKVVKSDGCWLWAGARTKNGYGNVKVASYINEYAHRVAYRLARGVLSSDETVCHSCDNPPCVRPDHLFKGTASDNMADASRKKRLRQQKSSPLFCKRNHLLLGDNLITRPDDRRNCVTCARLYRKAHGRLG